VNIPLLDLPDNQDLLPSDLDTPLLTVCARGNISLPGVLYLNSLGYRDAHSLTGGMVGWVEAGYDLESA
jgi:rhodanese-related sulfurtransferase